MKLISAITLLFLSSCSTIFWRDAKLFPFISFSETGKKIAYMRVHYKEKDSWNPLNGTTDKKNFTTQVILAEIENDLSVKKIADMERFPFWILPNALYYNDTAQTLAFMHGLNENEYGTPSKTVSVYNLTDKKTVNVIKGKSEIKTPLGIALSADASLLAVVSGEINESTGFYQNFKLHILNLANNYAIQSSFPIPDWQDSPEFELAWLKTESVLSARIDKKLLTVKTNSISETKFSGQNLMDSSKYAYSRTYKWESADIDITSVKLSK
ncbi:MAG: hypothetical protein KBF99_15960 [Leptospiraceae bacterium]|nr:hypothetical protein [Leptospiraceae bacterium]MBP9164674.1 hypothetical protein [Leptospiraceae bacterium]